MAEQSETSNQIEQKRAADAAALAAEIRRRQEEADRVAAEEWRN